MIVRVLLLILVVSACTTNQKRIPAIANTKLKVISAEGKCHKKAGPLEVKYEDNNRDDFYQQGFTKVEEKGLELGANAVLIKDAYLNHPFFALKSHVIYQVVYYQC